MDGFPACSAGISIFEHSFSHAIASYAKHALSLYLSRWILYQSKYCHTIVSYTSHTCIFMPHTFLSWAFWDLNMPSESVSSIVNKIIYIVFFTAWACYKVIEDHVNLPCKDVCWYDLQILQSLRDLMHSLFPPEVRLDQGYRVHLSLQVTFLCHPTHKKHLSNFQCWA